MISKKILQLLPPGRGEPLCSGVEVTAQNGERLDLSHFRTVVTVKNGRAKGWFGAPSGGMALDCKVSIHGEEFETQQISIGPEDIGKTLFCAGTPILSITGLNPDDGEVVMTLSEVVEPCAPGTCRWS